MERGKKIIAVVLCLFLAVGIFYSGDAAFAADNETDEHNSGVVLNKTATPNPDGTYTIQLETYATGEEVRVTEEKDVPTDIVLVIDQSGSMENENNKLGTTSDYFSPYGSQTNSYLYNRRHNNNSNNATKNLYYLLDKNTYVSVSVTRSGEPQSYTYSYSYTIEGNTTVITESAGAYIIPDRAFYQKISSSGERVTYLKALKGVLTNFVNSVQAQAQANDVAHRIAIVGYASSNYEYNNEILTGCSISSLSYSNWWSSYDKWVGSIYNKDGYTSDCKNALVSPTDKNGWSSICNAIDKLDGDGGTSPDIGLDMACDIFTETPTDGTDRNRVVILFTDGKPTGNGSSWDSDAANAAMEIASNLKNTFGVTVYTVGIFNGANATSAGSQNGNDTQKANWFMHQVSSNNGNVQSPSYYLSAADATALNSIFQQISNEIQNGGAHSINIDSDAIVRDVVSDYFELAEKSENAITINAYKCIGINANGSYQWSNTPDADILNNEYNHVVAEITEDGTDVDVTGFDFKEYWVGTSVINGATTYRGYKLVVSFNVKPREGFLGGNAVPTNGSESGIYTPESDTPIDTFDIPKVNVPIDPISCTVSSTDKNIYLLGTLTKANIDMDTKITIGDNIKLDLNATNYGLDAWQTEYIDITITYTDENKNILESIPAVDEDLTYTVTVEIKSESEPCETGKEAETMSASAASSIHVNVFKPVITWKDSEVFYGEKFDESVDFCETNQVGEIVWMHGEDIANTPEFPMIGEEPAIDLTCDAPKSIDTRDDIPVNVTSKIDKTDITSYTTFKHQNPEILKDHLGNSDICEFYLRPQTGTLTITKEGGNENEPYVFTIKKDGEIYTYAVIQGNGSVTIQDLPIGTYTIEENAELAWRYNAVYAGNDGVHICLSTPTGAIKCTNTCENNQWLNSFAIAENAYGVNPETSTVG